LIKRVRYRGRVAGYFTMKGKFRTS